MKWKTIVNTGAERGFVVVKASGALIIGQTVCWAYNATDNGLAALTPSSTNAALVAGIAHTAIASGSKGLVQVYGYDDDALVLRNGLTASNDVLGIGYILDICSASSCLQASRTNGAALGSTLAATNNLAATHLVPMFVLGETFASYATSNVTTTAKIFLRCL